MAIQKCLKLLHNDLSPTPKIVANQIIYQKIKTTSIKFNITAVKQTKYLTPVPGTPLKAADEVGGAGGPSASGSNISADNKGRPSEKKSKYI